MNRYVFVFRGGAVAQKDVSPADLGAHLQKWMVWLKDLEQKGQTAPGGLRLQSAGKTVRGTAKSITDGPFAEAKDLVTGTLPIHAQTLDAAVEIAKGCPIYEYDGSVEVRPVHEEGGR